MHKGFSLIEILVALVIISTLSIGVFSLFQVSLRVIADSMGKEGAITVTNEKLELVRNLSYDNVGVVGGLVPGSLPQNEVITRNNIDYNVNISIIYIDDPFDGLQGGNPNDTVANDYKKVTITTTWSGSFGQKQYQLITHVAPKGIETTMGGGTLRVNVLNAIGSPVPQTEIRIANNNVNPPINAMQLTDDYGILNVPGLPPSVESYSVNATKTNYSTDYTCAVQQAGNACTSTEGNPQPTKPHATVIANQLTELTMSIDLLSVLNISTLSQALPSEWFINTDTTTFDQDNPSFTQCSDGNYIFTWRDKRQQDNPRIYAQKYNQNQVPQWNPDLAVTTSNNQNNPEVVVDSSCNTYVVWNDDRNGNQDIYFNKYNSSGVEAWGGAKKINTLANSADQTFPQIVLNNPQNAEFVIWEDNRNDSSDIYVQKFNNSGDSMWAQEIKAHVYSGVSIQQKPVIAIDNAPNLYIIWQDDRNGNVDIFMQKISPAGNIVWPNDILVNTENSANQQQNPSLSADTSGNFLYIAWQDKRNGIDDDIYLQKYDMNGNKIFANDVRANSDSTTADQQKAVLALKSDLSVLYTVWQDYRNNSWDIYAQKIDPSNGTKLWTSDVRINSSSGGEQENPDITVNTNGYLVIVWQDNSSGDYNIRAAQFSEEISEPTSVPNVPLTIRGSKTLGNNPILYKFQINQTSDSSGNITLSNLEWDSYTITANAGYTLHKSEPPLPINILPNTTNSVKLFITPP